MIEVFRKYMTAENFIEYMQDYNKLYAAKQNKENWKASMQKRKGIKEPILRNIIERINNAYDYKAFKKAVNKTNLLSYMIEDENLRLFFQCSIYTGFLIETALNDEVKSKGAITEQSFNLDMNQKTDIKINNINYQIKAITYCNYHDKIDIYKKNKVQFIFYTIDKNNINFIMKDNKASFSADEVETMVVYDKYDRVAAAVFVDLLIKSQKGELKHNGANVQ